MDEKTTSDGADPESFGRWLLAQRDRGDWIDDLAKSARADPTFPKNGDPDVLRKHLREKGADGDSFEALDDAELSWRSSPDSRVGSQQDGEDPNRQSDLISERLSSGSHGGGGSPGWKPGHRP